MQAATIRNRELLNARDPEVRERVLAEMKATAEDPEKAYPFLLRTSMIASLRDAEGRA